MNVKNLLFYYRFVFSTAFIFGTLLHANAIGNPKSEIRNTKLEFRNTKLEFRNPKSEIRNPKDTIPLRDRTGDYLRDSVSNSFDLRDPAIIEKKVEFDPTTNKYYITEKIGDEYYRTPTVMTFNEYVRWKSQQQEQEYFNRLAGFARKRNTELVDPLSKIDFSATQNQKLRMLLNSVGVNGKLPEMPKLDSKKMGDNLIGMIFGDPPTVSIKPQGQIDLTLGGDYRYFGNPTLPTISRTTGGLLFNMDIQMRVTGQIGNKLNLNTAFNNKATFDFDNIMKLNYNSNVFGEDDIIKSIEAGNVNLPLRGTLIQGSQNLFGLKTELQFGYLRLTAIAAQQRNKKQNIQVQGGSQVQNFNVTIDQYDENRHFFLSHFNRNTYEKALKTLPLINSLFTITRMEVWVSNDRNDIINTEIRPIVALEDLGETDRIYNKAVTHINTANTKVYSPEGYLPDNNSNDLYSLLKSNPDNSRIDRVITNLEMMNLSQGQDFVKRTAKRLQPSEYSFNPKLGTISLTNIDRQQIVGVAYTYFYNGKGPFQVGEFGENVTTANGNGISQVLFLKMLKNSTNNPQVPLFDLMMKNVYPINAFVTNPQDLRLDIFYQDAGDPQGAGGSTQPANSNTKGEKRALPEIKDIPLLRLLNLDNLNSLGDPQPDGQFDFVPDVTIIPRTGRIIFPVLEPFGKSLKARIDSVLVTKGYDLATANAIADKYTYRELYDSTLFRAQEHQEKNRFIIRGQAKSSASNRIQLNAFGLRPGSVSVTAGGIRLLEGVDFAIDYGTAVVTVLNPAYVAPNIQLNVSVEDNSLFNFQTRTMLGLRADYALKKNFNIGATFMNLFETPYTTKVNYGDDPINNKVYGLDVNFTEDAPWLTKLVDKLPFISTKEPSKITFAAETAVMQPGHASAIDGANNDGGVVYLDDFEGSTSPYSLMSQPGAWTLASTPQKHTEWKESNDTSIVTGANRALLNWYRIDTYLRGNSANAGDDYVTAISQTEVFPNKSSNTGLGLGIYDITIPTFDLSYYPKERGPYNFDLPDGITGTSGLKLTAGLKNDGKLNAPETRWAGIQRGIQTTDFEASNVEYVDFWMLDPFRRVGSDNNKGKLLLHLGEVSEDVLRDGRKSFENGLPSPNNPNLLTDYTRWGKVPRTELPLPNSFSADTIERRLQDVGLDGLNDAEEAVFFQDYLAKIKPRLLPSAYAKIAKDPSNDDFIYYNDANSYTADNTVLQKYRQFNGLEGNSANSNGTDLQSATNIPDAEDANRDNSFDENEAYYEYSIPLNPIPGAGNDPQKGNLDVTTLKFYVENIRDSLSGRRWYHFRIPIDGYDSKHGEITDFRNIRFTRLIAKGFQDSVTLRFAKLDLVRNQWRRYRPETSVPGFDLGNGSDKNNLELGSVNIEENGKRLPFNYVIPPGIVRNTIPGSGGYNALQNEQALSMKYTQLPAKKARAAFKLFASDLRIYKHLKMFVHAESPEQTYNGTNLDKKMCIFMRVGSDFEKNYYEYEIPLVMTKQKSLPPNSPQPNNGLPALNPYADSVWNNINTFDIDLSAFTGIKTQRNSTKVSLAEVFSVMDAMYPNNKVKVIGNPDLGLVKGIMVGVYNKDDVTHDVEVWINELRATGINENTGVAALARMDAKLADFGTVSVSGNFLGIGYGAIDQRVLQRSREEVLEYNAIGNFEMGKFLKPASGIHIPMTVQHSQSTHTPEYDPYDLDIKLKDKINLETNGNKRDSIKNAAQTVQTINAISFNNVRKDRTAGTKLPQPWNIENFSVSYSNTTLERHDPIIANETRHSTKEGIDYTYSRAPIYLSPFKKLKTINKGRWTYDNAKEDTVTIAQRLMSFVLRPISEFNFNPLPNTIGFNTVLDRQLNTVTYRFSGEDASTNTFFQRRYTWDRNYTLQWDLTRSLKLNFDAKNQAVIDELNDYDPNGLAISENSKNKYILDNLKNFGRTKRYDQNVNLNWNVPFKNIPFMDWVSVRATYGASYGWEAYSYSPANDNLPGYNFKAIGNNINNKQNKQVNADLSFDNFYNQFKYLRKIQQPVFQPDGPPKPKTKRGSGGIQDSLNANPNAPIVNKAKKIKGLKDYEPSLVEKIIIRPLLTIRKVSFSFNEQNNSYVPGFTPQAGLFGMQDLRAPGWDYALGFQTADDNWLDKARRSNWLSTDIRQVRPSLSGTTQTITARITLEPFTDFKVDLDLSKNSISNRSVEYRNQTASPSIDSITAANRQDDGSYTISYLPINTFFKPDSDVFQQFDKNRVIVSQTLNANGAGHPTYSNLGYKTGYGPTNQDVLVPAFISAYAGKDPRTFKTSDLFNQLPQFNWRLSYGGLAKLPGLRDVFNSINITHGYKSTLTINSFKSDQYYVQGQQTPQLESPNEYYSKYDIPTVVVSEQFQPLLGIDASLKTGAIIGLSYRKSRNLALSLSDARLQETHTEAFTFKFGQRFKNVYIKFLDFDAPSKLTKKVVAKPSDDPNAVVDAAVKKKKKPVVRRGNDLVLNFDITLQDDHSDNHLFRDDNSAQLAGQQQSIVVPSRGSKTFRISPSATYTINKLLDLRFYIDYNQLIPYTSASFPSTTASGGFVITYKLQ